jgi:hypothetical protein
MIIDEVFPNRKGNTPSEAIRKHIGKQVFLEDDHIGWAHGRILGEEDEEVYKVYIFDGRGKIQLHYHDLKHLLRLRNY